MEQLQEQHYRVWQSILEFSTPSCAGSVLSPMIASIMGPKNLDPKRPKTDTIRSSGGFCWNRCSVMEAIRSNSSAKWRTAAQTACVKPDITHLRHA